MCGIVGFVAARREPIEPRLAAMLGPIHHRGPDDSGVIVAGGIGLAMRRLSIVGIDNGVQPIASEDERFAIVGNGELYNAPSLRAELIDRGHRFRTDSDIESLLHLFEERGPEALSAINGMFAVAILDRQRERVLIARDRLGIKPLFYAETDRGVSFASEIPAIVASLRGRERDALDVDENA
ncbi:MAG: asparagine synthetase B, partial [Planctomycetes bacterium]|nr:asparagine synthetase B [Planctomycetota bacterium]